MKRLILTLLVLLTCMISVHAQQPEYDYWVYLPVILRSYSSTPIPTSTPTSTPTTTPTPTPTPTPSPSSTSAPAPISTPEPANSVWILPNHSHYYGYGDLMIVGEVQNDVADYLRFVKVAANLFNSGGQLVGTDYTYIHLDNLSPSGRTCFSLWFWNAPTDWSYYVFETPSYWTGGDLPPNLTLLNVSGSYDPQYDEYRIMGQVRNDHSSEVDFVTAIGTLYDMAGTVVDCDYSYVNSTDLNPGQTSSFEIWFFGREYYTDVNAYRVQADGWPQ